MLLSPLLIWLLRIFCFLTFVGHGWVCLNGQMPIRALLWDEELMTGVVKHWLEMDWGTYVSSLDMADRFDGFVRVQGWVFLFMGACCLLPLRRWCGTVYLVGAVNLALLAGLKFLDAGSGIGMLLEHASQICLPVILYLVLYVGPPEQRWSTTADLVTRMSLALTYACHGLFAMGLYADVTLLSHPMPQSYLEMTMACLGLESETLAERILLVVGKIDILVAVLVFIRPIQRWPLIYMVLWGFLTALARPWAHPDSLDAWIPEMIYRAPHFGLPLVLLLIYRKRKKAATETTTTPD